MLKVRLPSGATRAMSPDETHSGKSARGWCMIGHSTRDAFAPRSLSNANVPPRLGPALDARRYRPVRRTRSRLTPPPGSSPPSKITA